MVAPTDWAISAKRRKGDGDVVMGYYINLGILLTAYCLFFGHEESKEAKEFRVGFCLAQRSRRFFVCKVRAEGFR